MVRTYHYAWHINTVINGNSPDVITTTGKITCLGRKAQHKDGACFQRASIGTVKTGFIWSWEARANVN